MFKVIKEFWMDLIPENLMPESPISKEKSISMSIEELKKSAKAIHPAGFYVLASKLFKENKKDESIFWFYVGSVRYRYFLSSVGDSPFHPENELFGRVQFEIGGMILDYAGGNPDFWAQQIAEANQWDSDHANVFFSKSTHPKALQEVKQGMEKLRVTLLAQKEEMIRQRIENGAEVRV